MAEGKMKTLFHVVKPLLTLINFLYGLNLGNRKPPGCLKRWRRRLHQHLVWHLFLWSLYFYCHAKIKHGDESLYNYRYCPLMFLLPCSFYLFAFSEPEVKKLIRRLKRYEMGRTSERVTSRMIKIFILTLAPVALFLTNLGFGLLKLLYDGLRQGNGSLSKDIQYVYSGSKLLFFIGAAFLFVLSVSIFPVLLTCLGCVLVSYCPSRLDDHVEDILRAHSPLRRATLLSKLCYHYYKLQPLASMTNRNMATAMSLMKMFTLLLWVFCCYILEKQTIRLLFNLPILQYSVPLLMYLVVAPSANDMQFKLFEAAAEVLMVDDQWRGHDPTSRSLLAKMRLNLLQHLVHIRMDQGPFTLLGDSVDPETLFMIFIEANDLRTTLR